MHVDGFHSSASDPILQAKYGHVKEVKAIAPPPIGLPGGQNPGNAPQYNMYNTTSHPYSSPSIYNRYVPYDAHTNGPASIPNVPPVNPQTIYPQGQYGQQSNVFIPGAPVPGPPPVMSAPANSAPLAAPLAPAPWASPPVAPLQGKSAFQRPVEQPPVGHSTSMNSLSSAGGRSDPFSAANRLLGNVAVAKDVVVDAPLQEPASAAQSTTLSASVLTTSSAPAVFPAEAPKSDDSPIIVFNPTTDSSVELSSTSSAVM